MRVKPTRFHEGISLLKTSKCTGSVDIVYLLSWNGKRSITRKLQARTPSQSAYFNFAIPWPKIRNGKVNSC